MQTSRIVLVALYDYHSLGVRGLHSWLESKGYDVRSLYFFYSTYTDWCCRESDILAAMDWLKEQSPDYIGISVRSPLFPLFSNLSDRIRAELPKCKIIAGGAHATAAPESCMAHADYVVRGEGEHALVDILEGRASPGIVEGREFEDLDLLPFPYYGPRAAFHGVHRRYGKISYNTSRGCFFRCSYCQECVRPVSRRRKSPEAVASDLAKFREMLPGLSRVTFSDSVFVHDEDWLGRFGDLIRPGDYRFWVSGTAPFMTERVLGLMKRIGFDEIRLGVQSGSPRIRGEIFNRKDSLEQILFSVWESHRLGIATCCDFIIDNPYDTPETLRETREYIRKLPWSSRISKFELRYWPGTELTRKALADGVISASDVSGSFLRFGQWSYVYQISEGVGHVH